MEPKDYAIEAISKEAGKSMNNPYSKELIIRSGRALDPHDPVVVRIGGQIEAPLRWLKQRVDTIDQKKCYVIVNREAMTITLVTDEKEWDGTSVTGRIEISPEFIRFGINNEERRLSTFDMADLIKMNRSFFETRNDAMVLVSQLRNFKAKVDKDLEQSDDRRGNNKVLLNQTVESNIPEAFKLRIPIFRGEDPVTFEVEVDIDPKDFSCALVSPEAMDHIHTERDNLMDAVLEGIAAKAPDIVIIEQ